MNILYEKGVKSQRIKGTVYVYRDTPYWDKDKKQNRHKRDYIGKLGEGGEFIPNKKYLDRQNTKKDVCEKPVAVQTPPANDRKFFGAVHLLDCIGKSIGIVSDLQKAFGKSFTKLILSLVYFLIIESESSMYRFKKFAHTHAHPHSAVISSQRISEVFSQITENDKMEFFTARAKRCLENEYLVYDTTSISSYSETMEQVKYGHNKDMENLPQINLACVFGEESMLPVYYRKMPGNISDVSTIKKLITDLRFIGLKNPNLVLDRGFYSAKNINALYTNRYKFVVAGRANTAAYKNAVEEKREEVKHYQNLSIEHDIYCTTKESTWKHEYEDENGAKITSNKPIYIHVYYNGTRAEKEKNNFTTKLKYAELAYISGSCSDAQSKLVEKYFEIKETENGAALHPKQSSISEHMRKFGYFVLLSNHIQDAALALTIYRNKDVVEKTFYNIKNRLNMKRTHVSTEESLEGKLFVQFVALIYISYIHQIMQSNNLYKNYSMASLLDELDVIEIFTHNGHNSHTSEITEKQLSILRIFDAVISDTL